MINNRHFEDNILLASYKQFYREAILKFTERYFDRNEDRVTKSEWAIKDAQTLMSVMGYTNGLEN